MLGLASRRAAPRFTNLFRATAQRGFMTSAPAPTLRVADKVFSRNGMVNAPVAAQKILPEGTEITWTPTGTSLGGVDGFKTHSQLLAEEIAKGSESSIKKEGLVFEFSVSWLIGAYQEAIIGLGRNLFQTVRPLLILFVFGQILKAGFFAMGAPMLLSFYSIWMFEVFYGLAQCVLSFIFVSFFYNNMSFIGAGAPGGHNTPRGRFTMQYCAVWATAWVILGLCGAAIPSDCGNIVALTCITMLMCASFSH